MNTSRQEMMIMALLLVAMSARVAMGSPVVANVASSWTYNSSTGLYTYSYTVTNAVGSANYLDRVGIRPLVRPIVIESPTGWAAWRGWKGDTSSVVWAVVDPGPEPPNWKGQFYIGPYHLAPGASLGGFKVISDHAPDSTASFSAQGFDTIPSGAHSFGVSKPPLPRSIWAEGWTGAAIVPRLGAAVGVAPVAAASGIRFYPPVPNPTQQGVDLTLFLPRGGAIEIRMFDVVGHRIRMVFRGDRAAGMNRIAWDGRNDAGQSVAPGMYFYELLYNGRRVGERRIVVLP